MSASKEAILLVEDDPSILKLTTRIVASLGYHVHAAANGTEALAVYAENRDDIGVVLTDVQMPDLSGKELAVKIRETEPDLPIVFVSGYAQDQLSEDTAMDNVFFIQKPFNKARLDEVITEAMGEPV